MVLIMNFKDSQEYISGKLWTVPDGRKAREVFYYWGAKDIWLCSRSSPLHPSPDLFDFWMVKIDGLWYPAKQDTNAGYSISLDTESGIEAKEAFLALEILNIQWSTERIERIEQEITSLVKQQAELIASLGEQKARVLQTKPLKAVKEWMADFYADTEGNPIREIIGEDVWEAEVESAMEANSWVRVRLHTHISWVTGFIATLADSHIETQKYENQSMKSRLL